MSDEEEEVQEESENTLEEILKVSLKFLFAVLAIGSLVLYLIFKIALFEWTMAIFLLGFAVTMVLDSWER